jgi:hypothetical protein
MMVSFSFIKDKRQADFFQRKVKEKASDEYDGKKKSKINHVTAL